MKILVHGCYGGFAQSTGMRQLFGGTRHGASGGPSALDRPEMMRVLVVGLVLSFPFSLGLVPAALSLWCFLCIMLSSLSPCPARFFFLSSASPAVTQSLPSQASPLCLSHGFRLGWASCCSLQAEGRQRTDGGWSGPDTHPSHPKCGGGEDRKEELLAVPMPLTMSLSAAGLHQMLVTLAAGTVESGAFGPSL